MDVAIDAYAQGAPAPPGGLLFEFLPLLLLFLVFYFLLFRPQLKRQREHRKLIESLAKGQEVVTGGGLAGRITDIGENFVLLEVAKGVEVRVEKQAVSKELPKGALKVL